MLSVIAAKEAAEAALAAPKPRSKVNTAKDTAEAAAGVPNPQPKVAAKLAAEAAARAPQSRRKAAAQSQEQRNVAPEEKRGPEAIIFDGQISAVKSQWSRILLRSRNTA